MLEVETIEEFEQVKEELKHKPIVVAAFRPDLALILFAQLQMAVRHFHCQGLDMGLIKDLSVSLQEQLCNRCPSLANIMDQGWHPEFDEDPTPVTYSDLDISCKEEILVNAIAFQTAVRGLSQFTGTNYEVWASEITRSANNQVDAMEAEAVEAFVSKLVETRQRLANAGMG